MKRILIPILITMLMMGTTIASSGPISFQYPGVTADGANGLDIAGALDTGIADVLVTTTVGSGAISQSAKNEYVICTGACQVTALVAAAGNQLCVRNGPGSATIITLVNRASQYYELTDHSAWATVNQKLVSGGVATDSICIVGYDATHYVTMNFVGTWTDTAP